MTSPTRSRGTPGLLDPAAGAALLVALGFALLSPPDVVQGDLTRMLYIHVPSIITAYLAFGLTTIATIGYLFTRRLRCSEGCRRWCSTSPLSWRCLMGVFIALSRLARCPL